MDAPLWRGRQWDTKFGLSCLLWRLPSKLPWPDIEDYTMWANCLEVAGYSVEFVGRTGGSNVFSISKRGCEVARVLEYGNDDNCIIVNFSRAGRCIAKDVRKLIGKFGVV